MMVFRGGGRAWPSSILSRIIEAGVFTAFDTPFPVEVETILV